jgi:hypothetical protein
LLLFCMYFSGLLRLLSGRHLPIFPRQVIVFQLVGSSLVSEIYLHMFIFIWLEWRVTVTCGEIGSLGTVCCFSASSHICQLVSSNISCSSEFWIDFDGWWPSGTCLLGLFITRKVVYSIEDFNSSFVRVGAGIRLNPNICSSRVLGDILLFPDLIFFQEFASSVLLAIRLHSGPDHSIPSCLLKVWSAGSLRC